MYDPIAWGNLSGEAVEDLLATLISRERPHVNHIRPSSGDHGRDLEVKNEDGSIDVYQIKKFYSNLTKGRKRQIEASWDRLNEYIQDSGVRVAHWYLTMPLNPTPENLEWFHNLTTESPIECIWLDKTYIESLVAKYPEVIDFYLHGGRERLREMFPDVVQAFSDKEEDSTCVLAQRLQAIQKLLNEQDPHYDYDLRLFNSVQENVIGEVVLNPRAVCASWEIQPDGKAILIEIIPKFGTAPLIAPLETTFRFMPQTEDQKAELDSFFTFGTSLTRCPVEIKKPMSQLLPWIEPALVKSATCSVKSAEPQSRTDLVLRCKDASVTLHNTSQATGIRGGGHWFGEDDSSLISVRLLTAPNGETDCTVIYRPENLGGKPIREVCRVIDFCESIHANSSFNLETMDGELLQIVDSSTNGFDEAIYNPELFNVVKVLADLQHFTNAIIRFPEKGIHNSEIREWVITLRILEHKDTMVFIPWESECVTLTDPAHPNIPTFPCGITGVRKLVSTIDGESCFFGYYQWWANAGSGETIDEDQFVLKPVADSGSNALKALHYIEPSPQEREINRQLYYGPSLDFSQYRLISEFVNSEN